MFPKTARSAAAHRKHKRSIEVSLIVDFIADALRRDGARRNRSVQVLEFGSGRGYQIPYLKAIGDVVASDLWTSDEIKSMQDVRFVQCSITDTGFDDGQFDVIFSNHVIEHLDNLPAAFLELKRIGRPDCLYAFSVPTNVWLMLTIPEQYRAKLRRLIGGRPRAPAPAPIPRNADCAPESGRKQRRPGSLTSRLLPSGHGIVADFGKCYRSFKAMNWRKLFRDNGFSIVAQKPLLLYGPSEWPIIPTTRNVRGICSSVLFLLRKPLEHA
jgi:SAM-dependent methyltransferase